MDWSHDSLWSKAKLYAARAFEVSTNSELFPFWATLALEFLCRSALAKVHPTLLADPRNGDNLLYACGYGSMKNPRSVPAKTVISRCQAIIENFTKEEANFAFSLIERRNSELHSGAVPFVDFPTGLWLAKYFRVCKSLLDFQEYDLADLFGETQKEVAIQMIEASSEKRKAEVLKEIGTLKKSFTDLATEAQTLLKSMGEARIEKGKFPFARKQDTCPVCESTCIVDGEIINTTEPRLVDDELVWETTVLPTHLKCPTCDFELTGHEALHIAELGGQFSVTETTDATDYYLSEIDPAEYFDPADYYEADYGND